jgi:negative regulator of replication initiation
LEHRSIEIDFDVHKRIEAERTSFGESANDVLRRLLGIGQRENKASVMIAAAAEHGRSWTGKSVMLPGGTQVRMDYNGQQLTGVITDGKWIVEGREF